MKKTTLIIASSLALVAGGVYYLKTKSPQSISINPATQSPSKTASQTKKFAQLIQEGKPYSCIIKGEGNTIVYQAKDGKVFFKSTHQDKTSYGLTDDQYTYSWGDQSPKGFKIPTPKDEDFDNSKNEQLTQDMPQIINEADYQQYENLGYTVNCTDKVDESLFTPPSNIEFVDPTAMIQPEQLQQMADQFQSLDN